MIRKIEQVHFPEVLPKKKRVAAYARVSSGKDAMLHSLSAQISYYSKMIQSHGDWEYVGVYADEALTGTKENRENFQRLLEDCRSGKVDMVITKSISRFARNTIALLETVRELKSLGVDVYFEEQNIHTSSSEGELMLTILASYAQEESLSVSENMKWRIRRNFEDGKPWNGTIFGYRMKDSVYTVVPDEANIVKRIYREFLEGSGANAIMRRLNEDGIPSRTGKRWCQESVLKILKNYSYTGNLLLQKTYNENHLTKRKIINNGERPQYHVSDAHEAIIDIDTYESVQNELVRRAEYYAPKKKEYGKYPFSGLIVCGVCGKKYRRKTTASGIKWVCTTYNNHGKNACASKAIPERVLYDLTADVTIGDLTAIQAENGNTLVFCFKDGTQSVKRWKDRSRAESWTDEMKEKARQLSLSKIRGGTQHGS